MKQSKTLQSKEIKYEKLDSDPKKRKKSPSTKVLMGHSHQPKRNNIGRSISTKFKNLYDNFIKYLKKIKNPKKKAKKSTKEEQKMSSLWAKKDRKRDILGIGQLLVVVSIAYSTSVILIGVDSFTSRLALLPQIVFALAISINAFSKLYK